MLTKEELEELEELEEMERLEEEIERRELLKNNYLEYITHTHYGAYDFKSYKHVRKAAEVLEKVNQGEIKRLLILSPPQNLKSTYATESFPSYYLGHHPDNKVIALSYGGDLSMRFGEANRRKVAEFGKEIFGIEISKEVDKADEFELSNGVGGMISRGIMAGITGSPASLIICDDPVKNRQEADSETYRENMWDEWLNSIKTRLAARAKVIFSA